MANQRKNERKSKSNRKFRTMLLEQLQSREVFDGGGLPVFLTNDGVLKIEGTPDHDDVYLSGSNGTVQVDWTGKGKAEFNNVSSVEFRGREGNDSLRTYFYFDRNITAWGGAGNDTLNGAYGRDTLHGGDGHDVIDGGENPDRLFGEGGNDRLRGGAGGDGDVLHGGDGDDQLDGEAGNDELYGENDNDILVGGSGNDLLYGGNGADSLDGGLGHDNLDASGSDGSRQSRVYWSSGDDVYQSHRLVYRATDGDHVDVYAAGFVVNGQVASVGSLVNINAIEIETASTQVTIARGNDVARIKTMGMYTGTILKNQVEVMPKLTLPAMVLSDGTLRIEGTAAEDNFNITGHGGAVAIEWIGRGIALHSAVKTVHFVDTSDKIVPSNIAIDWGQTRKLHFASNGSVYSLKHDGLLEVRTNASSWVELATNVKHFDRYNDAIWTLHSDNYVRKNNQNLWSDTRDFKIDSNGTMYWLGVNGLMQRKEAGNNWIDVANDVLKFELTADGAMLTLHENGDVRRNGIDHWSDIRDFVISEGAEVYRLGFDGLLQFQDSTSTWIDLAYDVKKMGITVDGQLLTLHKNDTVRSDGNVWLQTNANNSSITIPLIVRDIEIGWNGTLYRLGMDDKLQRQSPAGHWEDVSSDVIKFSLVNGAMWTLHRDGYVRKDGINVWENTRDFLLTPNGTIYWLGVGTIDSQSRENVPGNLSKKLPGGNWADVANQVTRFSLADDGRLYYLSGSHELVRVDATSREVIRENVSEFWLDYNELLVQELPAADKVGSAGKLFRLQGTRWVEIVNTDSQPGNRLALDQKATIRKGIENLVANIGNAVQANHFGQIAPLIGQRFGEGTKIAESIRSTLWAINNYLDREDATDEGLIKTLTGGYKLSLSAIDQLRQLPIPDAAINGIKELLDKEYLSASKFTHAVSDLVSRHLAATHSQNDIRKFVIDIVNASTVQLLPGTVKNDNGVLTFDFTNRTTVEKAISLGFAELGSAIKISSSTTLILQNEITSEFRFAIDTQSPQSTFVLQKARIAGAANVNGSLINGELSVGPVSLSVDKGNASLHAPYTLDLLDPSNNFFDLKAHVDLPVKLTTPFAGLSVPEGSRIQLRWDNLVGALSPTVELSPEIMGLMDIQSVAVTTIVDGLSQLQQLVQQVQSQPFFANKIPVLNRSLAELVNPAGQLQDALKNLKNSNPKDLADLYSVLKDQLKVDSFGDLFGLNSSVLKINLEYGVLESADLPLSFSLLQEISNLVDLSGSVPLHLTAEARASLQLIIDFSDANHPVFSLGDSSKIEVTTSLNSPDIDFTAALGPLGVFIENGKASFNDGNGPAHWTIGLTPDPVDHRYPLDEVPANVVSNAQGTLKVELPVAFPTKGASKEEILVLLNLANSHIDLPTPSFDLKVTVPDFATKLSEIDLSDVFDQLLDGWDGTIRMLQDALRGKIGDFEIPLIGNQLADAAEFLEKLRTGVIKKWEELLGRSDDGTAVKLLRLGAETAANGLYEVLGPSGFQWLKDSNKDGTIDRKDIRVVQNDEDVSFSFELGRELVSVSTPIRADLGLPALGMDIDADLVVKSGFSMNVGFGVSRSDGFYIDTTSDKELDFKVVAELPNASITGTLGFLKVDVTSKTARLVGDFSIDVQDPSGDGRLSLAEIFQEPEIVVTASANANVNLEIMAGFNSPDLPSIGSEFLFDWHANGDTGFAGTVDRLEFGNVTVSMGNLINGFTNKVREALKPVKPLVDVLTSEIPVIGINLLDMAVWQGYIDPSVRDVVYAIKKLLDSESGVRLASMSGNLNIGKLVLDGNATRDANRLGELEPGIGSVASSPFKLQSKQSGFSIPILDNPWSAFGLLLGKDVNLVIYDPPALDFYYGISHSIPIFGPIIANIGGGIGAHLDFGFGLDTRGLREFVEYGFSDVGVLANGFFISDRVNADGTGADVPEATLWGEVYVGVGIDIGILKATVNGGLRGEITIDLREPEDDGKVYGDGKVYFDEFLGQFGNGGPFNINAALYFELFAEAKLSLGIFNKTWRHDIARTKLAEFPITGAQTVAPQLAEQSKDGVLTLNVGSRAAKRGSVNTVDDDDVYEITVNPANNTVQVTATFKVQNETQKFTQTFTGVTKIVANGGKGDDKFIVDVGTIPIELHGGIGDDEFEIRSSGSGFVRGDKGKDTIKAIASNVQIFGDDGDDTLTGGDVAQQVIHGGAGNDTIKGGKGNQQSLFGDAGDDTITGGEGSHQKLHGGFGNDSITAGSGEGHTLHGGAGDDQLFGGMGLNVEIHGDDGDDEIRGSETSDRLYGGAGNDRIFGEGGDDENWGGRGNDELHGGIGNDRLFGETGMDWLLGEIGNDYLFGGSGTDTLEGGRGDDHLWGGQGLDRIFDQEDNDTLYLDIINDASKAVDEIYGGINRDTIVFEGTGNADSILLTALSGERRYRLELKETTPSGEVIDRGSIGFAMPSDVSDVSDVSGVEVFRIDAKEGDDEVHVDKSFIDRLQIEGGIGNDLLVGGSGTNTIWGGKGNDLIIGGDLADELHGGEGDDILLGRGGSDALFGESGADVLIGGSDSDFLYGGSGVSATSSLEGDLIFGDNFHNVAHWKNGLPETLTEEFLNKTELQLIPYAAEDINVGNTKGDIINADDDDDSTVWDDDIVFGSDGRDKIDLGSGNDWADGRGDTDHIDGGDGNDTLYGGHGIDQLSGRKGNDKIYANNLSNENENRGGSPIDSSSSVFEVLQGYAGDDEIHGGSNNDRIDGGSGSDAIFHSDGDDAIFGGTDSQSGYSDQSKDTYIVQGTDQADVITISSIPRQAVYVSVGQSASLVGLTTRVNHLGIERVQVNALGGDDIVTIAMEKDAYLECKVDGGHGKDFINGAGGTVVTFLGSDQIPTGYLDMVVPWNGSTKAIREILPSDTRTTLIGGNDDDVVVGGAAQDEIHGGHGNDVVHGNAGDDQIHGDDGDDILFGNSGFDTLYGGNGADFLDGGADYDALYGGASSTDVDGSSDEFIISNTQITNKQGLRSAEEVFGSLVKPHWAEDRVIFKVTTDETVTVDQDSLRVGNQVFPVAFKNVGMIRILSGSPDVNVIRGTSSLEILVNDTFLDSFVPGTYRKADGSKVSIKADNDQLKLIDSNDESSLIVLGHNRVRIDGTAAEVVLLGSNRHALKFESGEQWMRLDDIGGKFRDGNQSTIFNVVQTSTSTFTFQDPYTSKTVQGTLLSSNEFVTESTNGELRSGVVVHRLGGVELHWNNGDVFSDIDMTGSWSIRNGVNNVSIEAIANGLLFRNENGLVAYGNFVGSHEIEVPDWGSRGNLRGAIEFNVNAIRIHWQNGTVWTKYDLSGTWFGANGVKITANRTSDGEWSLSNGFHTGYIRLGTYNSVEGQFGGTSIAGSIEFTPIGLKIQWTDGTAWQATDLSGMWFAGAQAGTLISQNGDDLKVTLANGITHSAKLIDATTIQWSANGSWVPSSFVSSSHHATLLLPNGTPLGKMQLAGSWHYYQGGPMYAFIAQNGRQLTLMNENGGRSTGTVYAANGFSAWGMNNTFHPEQGTNGTGRPVIVFGNGTQWTQLDLSGEYSVNGKRGRIMQDGMYLYFITETGERYEGILDPNMTIRLFSSSNVGYIHGNLRTLSWTNGQVWTYIGV